MSSWNTWIRRTKKWDVHPADGESTAMLFEVDGSLVGAALDNADLGMYVGRILNIVASQPATGTVDASFRNVKMVPVTTSSVAFGPGRSDQEVMLVVGVGDAVFALDAKQARLVGTEVLAATQGKPMRPKH